MSRKGEELTDDSRGAVARVQNIEDGRVGRMFILEDLQGELTVAIDDGEEVVEIVGNASGKLADGIKPLRTAHLLFELLLLGNINED